MAYPTASVHLRKMKFLLNLLFILALTILSVDATVRRDHETLNGTHSSTVPSESNTANADGNMGEMPEVHELPGNIPSELVKPVKPTAAAETVDSPMPTNNEPVGRLVEEVRLSGTSAHALRVKPPIEQKGHNSTKAQDEEKEEEEKEKNNNDDDTEQRLDSFSTAVQQNGLQQPTAMAKKDNTPDSVLSAVQASEHCEPSALGKQEIESRLPSDAQRKAHLEPNAQDKENEDIHHKLHLDVQQEEHGKPDTMKSEDRPVLKQDQVRNQTIDKSNGNHSVHITQIVQMDDSNKDTKKNTDKEDECDEFRRKLCKCCKPPPMVYRVVPCGPPHCGPLPPPCNHPPSCFPPPPPPARPQPLCQPPPPARPFYPPPPPPPSRPYYPPGPPRYPNPGHHVLNAVDSPPRASAEDTTTDSQRSESSSSVASVLVTSDSTSAATSSLLTAVLSIAAAYFIALS